MKKYMYLILCIVSEIAALVVFELSGAEGAFLNTHVWVSYMMYVVLFVACIASSSKFIEVRAKQK